MRRSDGVVKTVVESMSAQARGTQQGRGGARAARASSRWARAAVAAWAVATVLGLWAPGPGSAPDGGGGGGEVATLREAARGWSEGGWWLGRAHAQSSVDEGDVVDRVEVRGNKRVEAEAVLRVIRQRVGDPMTYEQVSRDVRAIYALGLFDDVRALGERGQGGERVLVYAVVEKPQVLKVTFEGNDALDDDDIKEVINIKPFSALNLSSIKANEEKIADLYSEKGYFLTDVRSKIEPIKGDKDEVEVTFIIDEHAKVQVQSVTFLGNAALSDDELIQVMQTRPGGLLSFLTEMGTYRDAVFEADLNNLTAYYYSKGHIQAKVTQPQVRLSRDKKNLFISIAIEEGEEFFLESATLTGDFIKDKEDLERMITLKPGDVFNYSQMRQDLERIKNVYQDAGYAYANVIPIPEPNPTTRGVDLKVDIDKGPKVYFGRVEVVGNNKTRDKVVRRELVLAEGDLYSSTAINRSRARVQRLGFFETVDIKTVPSDDPNVVDVQVTVTERPTGTFQVGAGFSSVESFIATAQISQNNLFGRGQALSLQATLSSIRTLFQLRLSEPYLLDSNWNASFDVFDFEFVFNDFTRSSTGGNITLGYPLTELDFFRDLERTGDWDLGVISVAGTYKLETVEVDAVGRTGSAGRSVSRLFVGGLTSSVQGSVFWDRRDNRLFPTKGFFQTASVELAEAALGSENEFVRYTGSSRWYFPVVWDVVLRFNLQLGLVRSMDPTKEVPIFERFFVGGPNSVRGFQRATLGPIRDVGQDPSDPGARLTGFNIGGNKQLILNTEFEFPIFAAVGVKGVVFADLGNAFDDGDALSLTPDLFSEADDNFNNALRSATGFGVRWFSPIGPLRFEWGFPMRPLRGEDPLVFEFSIGNSF